MSDLDDAAEAIAGHIKKLAVEVMGDESYAHLVWKTAKSFLPKAAGAGGRPKVTDDGAGRWAARLLIFDWRNDLMADSQPRSGTDLDASPEVVLPTLRHVADWARQQARAYHAPADTVGLDDAELSRRIDSIRVQLSRRKGTLINWQLPYQVDAQQWTIVVRLVRATAEQVAAAKIVRTTWREPMPPLPVYEPGESPAELAQAAFEQPPD